MSSLTYQQILNSLETSLAAETLYEATHGPKPTYDLDGESYQWTEWTEAMFRKITACRALINAAQPYMISSRGRA
jgi:hypothetical protein